MFQGRSGKENNAIFRKRRFEQNQAFTSSKCKSMHCVCVCMCMFVSVHVLHSVPVCACTCVYENVCVCVCFCACSYNTCTDLWLVHWIQHSSNNGLIKRKVPSTAASLLHKFTKVTVKVSRQNKQQRERQAYKQMQQHVSHQRRSKTNKRNQT